MKYYVIVDGYYLNMAGQKDRSDYAYAFDEAYATMIGNEYSKTGCSVTYQQA